MLLESVNIKSGGTITWRHDGCHNRFPFEFLTGRVRIMNQQETSVFEFLTKSLFSFLSRLGQNECSSQGWGRGAAASETYYSAFGPWYA